VIGYVSILLSVFSVMPLQQAARLFHSENHAKYGKYKRPKPLWIQQNISKPSITLPYSLKMSNALKKRKIAVLGSRSVGEYWELRVIAVLSRVHCVFVENA
jgi:hypothetical protein